MQLLMCSKHQVQNYLKCERHSCILRIKFNLTTMHQKAIHLHSPLSSHTHSIFLDFFWTSALPLFCVFTIFGLLLTLAVFVVVSLLGPTSASAPIMITLLLIPLFIPAVFINGIWAFVLFELALSSCLSR